MSVGITIDREAEAEARAAQKAKMQQVAEEIIVPTPAWLSEALLYWSFELKSAQSIGKIWPSRKEVKDSLCNICELAGQLKEYLETPRIAGFMDGDPGAAQMLQMLQISANQALKSPEFHGKNGKLPKGAGKPLLSNTKPPAYLCAAVIAEIFQFFYPDKASKPVKKKAYAAAHKFWCACFKDKSWGSDPLTRWKDYFSAVEASEYEPVRKEVCRILIISRLHVEDKYS